MDDEVMRRFLNQVLKGLIAFEEASKMLLKQYEECPLAVSENSKESVALEQIRALLMEKMNAGKSEKIREIFAIFGINKLSELKSENYEEVFQMVKKL